MQLAGAIPPMITPTTEGAGDIDTETLGSFTEFLLDGGVHALFPCGSLGEFASLTRRQRSTVIQTVADHATDVPVLAGCGGTSVGEVRDLATDAAAAGADAVVVVTPYYLDATEEGLVEFYERIAREVSLPIFLYDIPSLTDNRLSVGAVADLATRSNVVGIKDSTGDIIHHQQLIEATPDSFHVLQGMAELAIPALDMGADGFVAGPANVYPEALSSMYEAYRRDDRGLAIDLWQDVSNPIVAATKPLPTATGLKYLLRRRGHDVGEPLPPLSPAAEPDRDRLDDCYRRITDHLRSDGIAAK